MVQSLETLKADLEKKLGREVEVEELSPGKWLVPYYNMNLKNRGSFVGDSPEDACLKLLTYLNSLDPLQGDTDGTEASNPG